MGELIDRLKGVGYRIKAVFTGRASDQVKGAAYDTAGRVKGEFDRAKTRVKETIEEEEDRPLP